MAKKRAKKQPTTNQNAAGRSRRKEQYNIRRVSAVVERLRDQAARLNLLARSMEDAGVSEIVVDGHAMLLRGMVQIDNFADNAARSLREAKTALLDL